MKVTLDLEHHVCTLEREPGAPRMNNESALFYALKKELQKQGHDVIKKCPAKDGCMFGNEYVYWVRTRRYVCPPGKNPGGFGVYDGQYAIRLAHLEYSTGELILSVVLATD
jgi:hypothetical protein